MKKIDFDENNITRDIIGKVLYGEVMEKVKAIEVNGCSIDRVSIREYDVVVDADPVLTKSQIAKCKKLYNERMDKKIDTVNRLIKKLDFVLSDVKLYQTVKNSLVDASYCTAETELDTLQSRYLRGTASTKAIYRARLAEYSKMKCS